MNINPRWYAIDSKMRSTIEKILAGTFVPDEEIRALLNYSIAKKHYHCNVLFKCLKEKTTSPCLEDFDFLELGIFGNTEKVFHFHDPPKNYKTILEKHENLFSTLEQLNIEIYDDDEVIPFALFDMLSQNPNHLREIYLRFEVTENIDLAKKCVQEIFKCNNPKLQELHLRLFTEDNKLPQGIDADFVKQLLANSHFPNAMVKLNYTQIN